MEYLVPVLILVVVAVLVGGGAWVLSRRSTTGSSSAGTSSGKSGQRPRRGSLAGRISSENAKVASNRMDQAAHREVYRLIAAGRTAEAVTAYRRSTGLGTFEAMMDIQALATYPQMWTKPAPAAESPAEGPDNRVPAADIADATDLVVPEDWLEESLPADRPFELEVVRDETTVRVSSDDLPPYLRDQLTALVRDGRVEDAALELSAHTVLTAEEALQFLHILQREQGQDD
ncbi:hypothetical protein [Citricoccus sp.]|uniref:hypothetical protein n=1 Tax=Citricoccus sp. TaxID=1978372 RepID=UPI0028BD601B|nr:hypothetical protein [Citricoccus sp.]